MLAAMSLPLSSVYAFSTGAIQPNGLIVAPIGASLYVAGTAAGISSQSHLLTFATATNGLTSDTLLFNSGIPQRGALQVAVNKKGTLVFVVNSFSGSVSVIDQGTNTVLTTITQPVIGPHPVGIRVSPNGKQLWIANAGGAPLFNNGTVSVVDIVEGSPSFGDDIFQVNTGGNPNEVIFNSLGTTAWILNGTPTGYLVQVNAKTFGIVRNFLLRGPLNSPHPLAMDITKNSATLWVGNGDTSINNIDIPAATLDTTVFMFPLVPIGLQDIGQVLVSPDQLFVVTADTDIGDISIANAKTNSFITFGFGNPGAHPYFMAFHGTVLYVSEFNNTGFGAGGGNNIIDIFTGL